MAHPASMQIEREDFEGRCSWPRFAGVQTTITNEMIIRGDTRAGERELPVAIAYGPRSASTKDAAMARTLKPLTTETLQEEVRFLLKTLLRDDLFGDEVGVSEAEKLLESSLSVGFVEYCAFLKRHAYLDIDRTKNTISVLPRGRAFSDGTPDPTLGPALAQHFAARLSGAPPPQPSMSAPPPSPPPLSPSPAPLTAPTATTSFAGESAKPRPRIEEQRKTSAALALLDRERWVRGTALGQGSLGTVVAARDAVLDRDVVVKEVRHVYELVSYVSREEITARVKNAVLAQARLSHPHILRVIDVSFDSPVPTIVVDRAAESLATRMERGLMPVDVVLRALLQAAYALGAAHAAGLVHGGLKPENVLFDAAGNVLLTDFGIARVTERGTDPTTSAPPVYVGRGHPSYMAPEQLHKGKVLPQGDVYALGILLYEMLMGNLPGRRSPMPSASERVVAAVGKDRIEALDDLFDKMTRDPLHERAASIDVVLEAIYAAFPAALVGTRGTLLMYERDPMPSSLSASSSADEERAHVESTVVTRAPIEPPR